MSGTGIVVADDQRFSWLVALDSPPLYTIREPRGIG